MDLLVLVCINLLLLPLIYAIPVEPVRIALGLAVVLFAPGYLLLAALFPRQDGPTGLERIAFSVPLSMALMALLGLALNFAPWGIRLTPVIAAVTAWDLGMAGIAWRLRARLAPHERFQPGWWVMMARARGWRRGEVFAAVVVALAVATLLGALAWRIQEPPPGEPFTQFYLLGPEGKAQGYAATLHVGQPQEYTVGIVNNERTRVTYEVRAFLGEVQVGTAGPVTLGNGERWEGTVAVVPPAPTDRQALTFRLLRDGAEGAYRSVHLWVEVLPANG